nr:retrovirus-related Pol polyprotein from transposon TNT 1-94 [Tanacetum cinerariifolium]
MFLTGFEAAKMFHIVIYESLDGADDVDAQEQPNLDEDIHPELPVPMPPFRGIDFDEIFSPVMKMGSIRVVLGLAASLDLEVEQMDVKTAFLHGDLDKEIYMEQSEGFQVKRKKDYVCRLQKSLYGLKQAPRQWFNMDKAKVVSSPLTPNFKLTDKDCPSSKKNIEKMDRVPYASTVGSLMYAMVCTRPDLAHVVGVVSRFMSNPDSDLAGNKDNMKSTSGYLMTFAGGAVSWQTRLQKCVALSTTEAEYVAATEACKELLWLKRFLQELGFKQQRYAVLCDNQSAIHLAKNSMFHKRAKHIDV